MQYSHHLHRRPDSNPPRPHLRTRRIWARGARSGRPPHHQCRPTPREAPENASGNRGIPACAAHRRPPRRRRIRGLHHRHPIPAAITHNSTRCNSPRPPLSSVPVVVVVPAASHPGRSGRNGAGLVVTTVATPGDSPDRPSARRRGKPCRCRPCGRAALPAAARVTARRRREVGERGGRVVASRAAPGESDARGYSQFINIFK
uniref:Uncharacterized protein n=1 Tax=Oryza nivara TaxID=4536 RepID=A0A0E0J388_ORYNI